MKPSEHEEIQDTERVTLEEASPEKSSLETPPDEEIQETEVICGEASPEKVFPEDLNLGDDDFEEIPVLDIPEAPLEVTQEATPGVAGPVDPNTESAPRAFGAESEHQHPLDALVKAYNGVGLATNILAASAISVLITTRHFAATRQTASKETAVATAQESATATKTNALDTEDGSSAATTTSATTATTSETETEKEDFLIATLSKIACHGILPECRFTFASLQPLNEPVENTNDEDGAEENSIVLDHLDNSILFDYSERRDLPSTEATSETKTKFTTAKGKKWRDRVLARKQKQQRRHQQQQQQNEQETEEQQSKPKPQLQKSCRQPSEGSFGIFTGTIEEGEMIHHPSLDTNSEPSEVAPPSLPRCSSSTLKVVSVAEESAPVSLSSISTTEGENEQNGFAQLVIGLSGSVGVCWANYPCGVSVADTTEDQQATSDTASFVTAMNLQENLAPESSSVQSFFTATAGEIDAVSDTNYKHNFSTVEKVLNYFHCKWNYESLSSDPSKNVTIATAVMDATDTAKGNIWEWITGVEPQTSVFSSSSAKEVLDSAQDELLLEETIDEVEMYLFGEDVEGEERKSTKSPGPTATSNDNMAESICIETILEDSSSSPFDNELPLSNIDVVVFGHDWRSSNKAELSASDSGPFCCWFDGSSWNSSGADPSHNSKPDKKISCEASLGSTQASTNISSSSSKVSKASSWFGKHHKQPWYVMPPLDPLSDTDGGSCYYDDDNDDEQSVSNSKNGNDMSRLAILRELHRFQSGLCSDRVMEMIHYPTTAHQARDDNVVVLY